MFSQHTAPSGLEGLILMVFGGSIFYQHAALTGPEGIILGVVEWGYQGAPYIYGLLSVQPRHCLGPSKERTIVKARALCCCRAVRVLDVSMSNIADR